MIYPKFYVGPMSKEFVDVVLENDFNVGFIPSRRQIESTGGYVNGWTTKDFSKYISKKKLIERDHGGPNQGNLIDDGIDSFVVDAECLDIVHVDVWKNFVDINDAANETCKIINILHKQNDKLLFEVGTEQSIRPYTHTELDKFLSLLQEKLTKEEFSKILYVVVQCGTKLSEDHNLGEFDSEKLVNMISICKKYNKLSKEHNGDYISNELRLEKLSLGLDAINIAPEFGVTQTKVILDNINEEEFEMFYKICLDSGKWKKWVGVDFDPVSMKKELITICGHYCFSDDFVKTLVCKNIVKIKHSLYITLYNLLTETNSYEIFKKI